MIREATTPSLHQGCGLRLALDTLILEVVRGFTEPKKIISLVSIHPAISKALDTLETKFRKNRTLSELAEEVGLSRSRLAELFNLEAGYSIHKFLTKVRVRHAKTLLSHSDLPIGDIALECGFATIQHFSRVFKEVTGNRLSISVADAMIETLENSLFRASEDRIGSGQGFLRSINSAGVTSWLGEVHVEKLDSWILKEIADDFFGSVTLDDVSTDRHTVASNARIDNNRSRSISGSESMQETGAIAPFRT